MEGCGDRQPMSLGSRARERVGEVFERAELGDPRRVRRAVGLAEALASNPGASLPKVWKTEAELEAGYRFLRSPQTDFALLMESVQTATRAAALAAGRVLVLHDTTDVTTPSAACEEVGYLPTGKAGFFVHHALCLSEGDSRPLGILWSQLWGRPRRTKGRSRNRSGGELAKEKERESDRWLEGAAEAHLWLSGCNSAVHVMDREADSIRLFDELHRLGADFVIRTRHNRRVEQGKLEGALEGRPVRLTRSVQLSARSARSMPRYTHKGRPARLAKLEVTTARVQLQPPRYSDAEPLWMNIVRIREPSPPQGAPCVEWTLATSLPTKTRAQLERVIDIYRARWIVEEFHKALKTGCLYEKRQLESFESLTTMLALSYPVATELLRVRTRARDSSTSAADALRPSLLASLRAHPQARCLPSEPTAEDALLAIAGLGGHLKCNGPPGWQTLAAGFAHLLAFEAGFLAAQQAQICDQS